jgi:hypothetical protein
VASRSPGLGITSDQVLPGCTPESMAGESALLSRPMILPAPPRTTAATSHDHGILLDVWQIALIRPKTPGTMPSACRTSRPEPVRPRRQGVGVGCAVATVVSCSLVSSSATICLIRAASGLEPGSLAITASATAAGSPAIASSILLP